MTGKMPDEGINPVESPDLLYDLWRWFLDLNASRQAGMGGVGPITYLELQAYSAVQGIRMEGWEIAAIRSLDRVALDSVSKD